MTHTETYYIWQEDPCIWLRLPGDGTVRGVTHPSGASWFYSPNQAKDAVKWLSVPAKERMAHAILTKVSMERS